MRQSVFLLAIALLCTGVLSIPIDKPPSGPDSPVHNILAVLPVNKIEEIEQTHLKKDDGFKAAILYLQGEEWRQLVNNVLKSPEYKKFAEMTEKFKLDISQAINCTRDHILSLKVVPTQVAAKPNLEPFVNDIQKVLPLAAIAKATANIDNPEAKKVRQEIGTKENQIIAENLHKLPEMVKMRKALKDMNFDVEPYIALVYAFLGWVH